MICSRTIKYYNNNNIIIIYMTSYWRNYIRAKFNLLLLYGYVLRIYHCMDGVHKRGLHDPWCACGIKLNYVLLSLTTISRASDDHFHVDLLHLCVREQMTLANVYKIFFLLLMNRRAQNQSGLTPKNWISILKHHNLVKLISDKLDAFLKHLTPPWLQWNVN